MMNLLHNPLRLHKDYHWLCNSSELLDSAYASKHLKHKLLAGHTLFEGTKPVAKGFNPTFKRLGIYFEKLVLHAIEQSPNFDVMYSNYQVRGNGNTLGEYDAILRGRNNDEILHCEVAVKFYLQINNGAHLSDWVGPGLHDRLDLKYKRLITHQLMLAEKACDIGINTLTCMPTDKKVLLTRGRLYYAFEHFINQRFVFPREVNPHHLKGFWIEKTAFISLQQMQPHLSWYDLPKPYWLAPFTADEIQLLTPFDIQHLVGAKQVVGLHNGRELMRGFVVTPEWIKNSAKAGDIQ